MRQRWPAIAGIPLTYWEGDEVKTRDGRIGTVLGYSWEHDLVVFIDGQPTKGCFIMTVDFGDHTEQYLRHDLTGERLGHGGFW